MRNIVSPLDGFHSPFGQRRGFDLRSLFSASEPGFYGLIRPQYLWQDVARTTPVASPGDLVASWEMQAGSITHATQSTDLDRPVYGIEPVGGRRNILGYTEDFTNAAWVKSGATIEDGGDGPNGLAAQKITFSASASALVYNDFAEPVTGAATVSFYVRADTPTTIRSFILNNGLTGFNPVTNVTTEWQLVTIARVGTGTGYKREGFVNSASGDAAPIYVAGFQVEEGETRTDYQRVGNAFDVTESGVRTLHYLSFNGVNQYMVTPTITPGTDKVQVFAGGRKERDEAAGRIMTFNASNDPGIQVAAPNGIGANYGAIVRGGSRTIVVTASPFAAPTSNVVSALFDKGAPSTTIRVDQTETVVTTDPGAGNFTASVATIGKFSATGSAVLNGKIYSLTARFGPTLTAAQIAQAGAAVAYETGVTL